MPGGWSSPNASPPSCEVAQLTMIVVFPCVSRRQLTTINRQLTTIKKTPRWSGT